MVEKCQLYKYIDPSINCDQKYFDIVIKML